MHACMLRSSIFRNTNVSMLPFVFPVSDTTMATFHELMTDRVFVDYFNVFLSLPVCDSRLLIIFLNF
jgi:hypothetical protein